MKKPANNSLCQFHEKFVYGQTSVRWMFFIITLLFVSPAFAAVENLDEAIARKSRMATATYSEAVLANVANYYIWQSETLNYFDIITNNEVWQLTNSPANFNKTQDISATHWSANGNRVLFHSLRDTTAFPRWTSPIWMLANTDGSRMRPAKNAAAQLPTMDAYPLWSPILADVLYQGTSNDGQGLASNGFYKVQVSDTTISRSTFLSVPGSTRLSLKKSISGDGRKVMITDDTNSLFQPATVYPEISRALDTAAGYNNKLLFDYYWGTQPATWTGYHDQFMTGAVNGVDGIWNILMPEGTDGDWWRVRTSGAGVGGAPLHIQDHSPPYDWGGEFEPVHTIQGMHTPWCPQGVVAGTDCLSYLSHFAPDRWGHYGISTKSTNDPYGTSIADLREHKYKITAFTPVKIYNVNAQWVQHHDWEAWSDWSVSSAYTLADNYINGAIVTQNVKDNNSQKMLASPHTRYNTNGSMSGVYEALARPTQSPDGTKALFNSTFLNPSDSYPQLFWTVAYYPYPPEIKSAVKASSNVRLTWDFNQGTSCSADAGTTPRTGPAPNFTTPRTYATRGWPHETLDCPPSPREIKQFRVWVSSDNSTWSPVGATTYNNCSGTNECGMWAETAWSYDFPQPNSTTRYYAVTSLEHSGLESRILSNIWRVTLDTSGNIVSQYQQVAYPSNPGGKSGFYTATPESPVSMTFAYQQVPATAPGQYTLAWSAPDNNMMIRYYNIYASDGSITSATQKTRIASIPATVDYTGSGNYKYVDWLGNPDGSTKYLVTSVDYQGNESLALSVLKGGVSSDPGVMKSPTGLKATPVTH